MIARRALFIVSPLAVLGICYVASRRPTRLANPAPKASTITVAQRLDYTAPSDRHVATDGFVAIGAVLTNPFERSDDLALSGRVTLADSGQPVEGATVIVRTKYVPTETTTNAHGWFTVKVPAGDYPIEAKKGALVGAFPHTVQVTPDAVPEDLVIKLHPGHVIAGHVRSDRGRAIEGAALATLLEGERLPPTSPSVKQAESVHSTSDGSYRIEGLLPRRYDLHVSAPGFGAISSTIDVQHDVESIEFVLQTGATIGGHVTLDGNLIGGAVISVREVGADRFHRTATTTTSREGAFQLVDLHPGSFVVEATLEGKGSATETVKLTAGEQRNLSLVLTEGATVSGIVKSQDGAPIGRAEVECQSQRVTTSSDGTFKFVGVAPGYYLLRAEAPEGSPLAGRRALGGGDIVANQHIVGEELVIAAGGHSIQGKVLAPDGMPAWGAKVEAYHEHASSGIRSATTKEDGRFEITDLAAGTASLVASKPGLMAGVLEGVVVDSSDVTVRLREPGSLSGNVVDGAGTPVERFRISAAHDRRDHFSFVWDTDREHSIHDAGGAFHIGGLAGGIFRVVVETSDGRVGALDEVQLADGQDRGGLRVVVAGAGSIGGHVVDHATGAPIPGARVSTAYGHTVTDDSGAFTVGGLAPGPIRVMVEADGYAEDLRFFRIAAAGRAIDIGTIHLLRANCSHSRLTTASTRRLETDAHS
jgi:protocatechuate 3,4-dioxygenase beta subunit